MNEKTVRKWTTRSTVEDAPMGPKTVQSSVLTSEEEAACVAFRRHIFDRVCAEHAIEHRITKPKHPWTNGQAERMNRTIKETTVKRYHDPSHQRLTTHLSDFIAAYNHGRRLKTLTGLSPYEFIVKQWTDNPDLFKTNPTRHNPGPNI